MKTRLSTQGRLVLPAELRRRDGIEPGQEFEIERLEAGEYRLIRSTRPANQGLVDWLLACPEKGYFVAIECESTESLRDSLATITS
jgi:AbrB family looped-hinge helix DNA binding protein